MAFRCANLMWRHRASHPRTSRSGVHQLPESVLGPRSYRPGRFGQHRNPVPIHLQCSCRPQSAPSVDAALFALRSPLSRGVLLADEVGLGKTIEAGIVLAQRWAERRRKILIVVPATLRKQWQQELSEKFHLPAVVMESQTWNRLQREGRSNPFAMTDTIAICSYHFAAAKADALQAIASRSASIRANDSNPTVSAASPSFSKTIRT